MVLPPFLFVFACPTSKSKSATLILRDRNSSLIDLILLSPIHLGAGLSSLQYCVQPFLELMFHLPLLHCIMELKLRTCWYDVKVDNAGRESEVSETFEKVLETSLSCSLHRLARCGFYSTGTW